MPYAHLTVEVFMRKLALAIRTNFVEMRKVAVEPLPLGKTQAL